MWKIWKAWFGIIFIGLGISNTIKYSNFWMLLFSLLGLCLYLMDRKKIEEESKYKSIVSVTAVVMVIMILEEVISRFTLLS